MSRTATIGKKDLVAAAFKITKKEGFDSITSRKLAQAAGCSTQPIFRLYENMDELKKDVFDKSAKFFEEYYNSYEKKFDIPFIDLGIAYIEFAGKYPQLFKLLFLSGTTANGNMYDLVNGSYENVVKEVTRAANLGVKEPEQLFMKMWIFIHGCGCMAVTKDFDLERDDTISLLMAAYHSFQNM